MEGALPALSDHRVLNLQRAIGGRARRLTTSKRPLLYSEVAGFWNQCVRDYRSASKKGLAVLAYTIVRDGFAIVLGFSAATRVSELLDLRGKHLQVDDDGVVLLSFASVKNRQTLFTTHQPFKIALRLPLLTEAFELFNTTCGFADDNFIFHRASGKSRDKLSRDWFASVVKSINPACSPHSVRVGAATELHAAGVPISDIMALGRWTSAAAVIYILGCLDTTIDASAKLGTADIRFVRGELRRNPAAELHPPPWMVSREDTTPVAAWLSHCAELDAEGAT
jgi:integrase